MGKEIFWNRIGVKGQRIVGILFLLVFLILSYFLFDWARMKETVVKLLGHPLLLLGMFLSYTLAFLLRALAWKWYLKKEIPLSVFLYALYFSLLVNHLLPVKAGDAVRIGVLQRAGRTGWDEAIHSVVAMRVLDLTVLGSIAFIGAGILGISIHWGFFLLFLLIVILVSLAFWFLARGRSGILRNQLQMVRAAFTGIGGLLIFFAVLFSWLLEAAIVFGVAQALTIPLPVPASIWVNSMTIAGQAFHFTPGGIGTYESVMSFSLKSLGFSWQNAYLLALISHGLKFLYSYLAGLYAWCRMPIGWGEMLKLGRGKGGGTV